MHTGPLQYLIMTANAAAQIGDCTVANIVNADTNATFRKMSSTAGPAWTRMSFMTLKVGYVRGSPSNSLVPSCVR